MGKPWKSLKFMEIHQRKIPWKRKSIRAKFHGKHGVLTILLHASMGENDYMESMMKARRACLVKPWNSMVKHGEIPWKSIGARFHGRHEGSITLSMQAWENHYMEKAWRKYG